jgi:hypothetical protein
MLTVIAGANPQASGAVAPAAALPNKALKKSWQILIDSPAIRNRRKSRVVNHMKISNR